jgi:predicted NUDIX family NTP pyrophosphohydrolase
VDVKIAAGVLVYRRTSAGLEVLLAHPGGPIWAKRDEGAWTIFKGEPEPDEELLACARRELREESGLTPAERFHDLGEIKQKGGKVVRAWAVEADADPATLQSNEFTLEWPPRSGKLVPFPELDRFAWFAADEARRRINSAQAELIDRLEALLG